MNDFERTLEHYRTVLERTVREHEAMKAIYTPRFPTWEESSKNYTFFLCIKCFVPCKPSQDHTCGRCWKVGDLVRDRITHEEFKVEKLYTFHWGKYGTMTGVRDATGYYEFFNERLELI